MELHLLNKTITTNRSAFVMGIINATPDSFYKDSRVTIDNAVTRAITLVSQGADILDIGSESTRPGSISVSSTDQIKRLTPIIQAIRKNLPNIPISIDTTELAVIKKCYELGALDIINDINSLSGTGVAQFAAENCLTVILMHRRSHEILPLTAPCFKTVDEYLKSRVDYAISCGISANNIIIDPGIGFGKDKTANDELLSNCGKLCGGHYPVLVGVSHKRGYKTLKETATANIRAIKAGATIIRVHEVLGGLT